MLVGSSGFIWMIPTLPISKSTPRRGGCCLRIRFCRKIRNAKAVTITIDNQPLFVSQYRENGQPAGADRDSIGIGHSHVEIGTGRLCSRAIGDGPITPQAVRKIFRLYIQYITSHSTPRTTIASKSGSNEPSVGFSGAVKIATVFCHGMMLCDM